MEELKLIEVGRTSPLPRAKYWKQKAAEAERVACVASGAMYVLGLLSGLFIGFI